MGGEVALGHPLGATGAILTLTRAYALERKQEKYGLVSMCIGGVSEAAGAGDLVPLSKVVRLAPFLGPTKNILLGWRRLSAEGYSERAHAADVALVARVVGGEAAAAAHLQRQAEGIVRHCVHRALRRWPDVPTDPQDLEQTIFLYLLEDDAKVLRGYGGRAKLTTWLHTVVSRRLTRELQRRARETDRSGGSSGPLDATPSPDDDPERRADRRGRADRVQAVLRDLPTQDRLLLQLLIEEDVPAPRVAELLGSSPDGVRMKKMRLLRRLSKKLAGLWP